MFGRTGGFRREKATVHQALRDRWGGMAFKVERAVSVGLFDVNPLPSVTREEKSSTERDWSIQLTLQSLRFFRTIQGELCEVQGQTE